MEMTMEIPLNTAWFTYIIKKTESDKMKHDISKMMNYITLEDNVMKPVVRFTGLQKYYCYIK